MKPKKSVQDDERRDYSLSMISTLLLVFIVVPCITFTAINWFEFMSKQQCLFENPPKPRANPRVMMHVVDAGCPDVPARGPHIVRMRCGNCTLETEWFAVKTITQGNRGIPCPACNGMAFDFDEVGLYEPNIDALAN